MVQYQKLCSLITSLGGAITVFCLLPLLLVLCGIFLIYRRILSCILRLKYGVNYGGLMNTADSMFVVENKCKNTIICALIVKLNEEQDMNAFMEKNTLVKMTHPKLSSIYRKFGGYAFWLRNCYKPQECLRVLPVSDEREFNEDYLKEIMSYLYTVPFPQSDSAVWDIHITQKHLKGMRKDGIYYPLVFRFNHAVADGTSLFQLLINGLASNDAKNYSKTIFDERFKEHSIQKKRGFVMYEILNMMIKLMNLFGLSMYVMFIGAVKASIAAHLRKRDQNALHGQELTGEKIITWRVEENPEYIPIVKRIRNRVPKTKFSHILMTAMSASFTAYFEKSQQPVPDLFSCIMAVLLNFPDIDTSKPVSLENKTTFVVYEVPTNKNQLLDTLERIKFYGNNINHGDIVAFNVLAILAGILPLPILSCMLGPLAYTSTFTNMPGCGEVCLSNEVVVDSVLNFSMNTKSTGVSLSFSSYDNKLKIGILVDKAILSSQEEAQKLIDDIFCYIKCLDIETRRIYGD